MSESVISGMLGVAFAVSIIFAILAFYFLWKERNRYILAFIITGHILVVIVFPLIGTLTWLLLFLAPYSDGREPERNSFNDKFSDWDER